MAKSGKKMITFEYEAAEDQAPESPFAIALRHLKRRQQHRAGAPGSAETVRHGGRSTVLSPHLSHGGS